MIRLPRDMSADDVNQWLNGGVFLVRTKPSAALRPAYWIGIHGGSRVMYADMETGEESVVPHTSCYAVWPDLGSFNHPAGYAVHMRRRAERQYRRTLNHRCVDTSVPWGFRVAMQKNTLVRYLAGWGEVSKLPWFGKWPSSFDEVEDWLAEGYVTVAVNRRLVVAGSPELEKRMLYLDGQLVGTVIGGELFPTCGPATLAALNKQLNGRYTIND